MLNRDARIKNLEGQIKNLLDASASIKTKEIKEWFLNTLTLIEEFTYCLKESSLSDEESYSAQKGLEAVIEYKIKMILRQIIEELNSDVYEETNNSDIREDYKKIKESLVDLRGKIETVIYSNKIRNIYLSEINEELREFAERVIPVNEEMSYDDLSRSDYEEYSDCKYFEWDTSNYCFPKDAALLEKLMGIEFRIFDEILRETGTKKEEEIL